MDIVKNHEAMRTQAKAYIDKMGVQKANESLDILGLPCFLMCAFQVGWQAANEHHRTEGSKP